MSEVFIRQARPTDYALVLATWKSSLADSRWARRFEGWEYWALANLVCDLWLPELEIRCGVLPEDDDTVVAWCAVEGRRVVWVYTKHKFRELGIARQLRRSWDHIPERGPTSLFERIKRANESTKSMRAFRHQAG